MTVGNIIVTRQRSPQPHLAGVPAKCGTVFVRSGI